jgi:formamidopyrimidine-DNA glycosylase
MPELPEVETIRRQLAPLVEGRTLERLTIEDPRWCAPLAPDELVAAIGGRRIETLGRRGKYMIWTFAGEIHLLLHLRMTGTLLYDPDPAERFRRVVLDFDDGHQLWFCDQRRFGTGELALGDEGLADFLAPRLGIEPLGDEFTAERLRELARGRRAPVKAFLLDQTKIAGVGNIYADEALYRARIHPLRPVGQLQKEQFAALRDAIVTVLELGISKGGSTIDDFRHADGVQGSFQNEFLVHTRRGEPCPSCGRAIVKFVAAGRGTYACESCQTRPRNRRSA